MQESLSATEAQFLFNSGCWRGMSARDIVRFQLFETQACLPWPLFQQALSEVLGRSIASFEIAGHLDEIRREVLRGDPPPTLGERLALLPRVIQEQMRSRGGRSLRESHGAGAIRKEGAPRQSL